MKKSRETMHGFFHDYDFEDVSFLLLIEPYISLDIESYSLSVFLFYTSE